jgi:hypothetical protein
MRVSVIGLLALAANVPAIGATPARNLVVSKSSPALTLQVDSRYVQLKPLKFPIERLTNAERRIFVQARPDRTIERMVIVQFEKVQPGSDFRFLYPSTPPRKFGAETYRFGTFVFNEANAARRQPKKEPALTREFLKKGGYRPATLYRVARLARVTDPKGLSEAIIFYMENSDTRPPAGKPDEDGDYELSPEESAALAERMEAAVKAVRG